MKLIACFMALLSAGVAACSGGEAVLESSGSGKGSGPSDRDRGTDDDSSQSDARIGSSTRDSGTRRRDGGSGDGSCETLTIAARPVTPEILIVLDRSGSMIGSVPGSRNRWAPTVHAVESVTMQLTDTVAFGLMTFPSGNVDVCAPGRVDVPVATGSASEIARFLAASTPTLVGNTPTAASLDAAHAQLSTSCVDCAEAPKYVLLVTDGQPTCGASRVTGTTPETIDATVAAIDRLAQARIPTYVVGYDTLNDPAAATSMDLFAMHGGTGRHIPVDNERTLITELTRIASNLVSCEYTLSAQIPDPRYVRVTIDGVQHNLSEGAWRIEGDKIILEGACDVLRDAKAHVLQIVRECMQVPVI